MKVIDDPTVVFDLDDTLIDLKSTFYDVMRDIFGKTASHWSEWEEHGIEKYFDLTVDDIKRISNEREIFKMVKPHLFSQYILEDLHRRGIRVVILTAREGFVPDPYNNTAEYLDTHNLYYDDLIISGHGQPKGDFVKHYSDVIFTVDDQVKNCDSFAEVESIKHVFLHALPHNRNCSKYVRLHNLYQAYPYVDFH